MKVKKFAALGLAATMVLGNSAIAFAEDVTAPTNASQTGAGSVEGTVDTDVFNVVLPTTTESTLKFILDPEGLIQKTEHSKYAGATFEEGKTLFFQTDTNNYTDTSQVLSITNKSSVSVDVSLKAEVTDASGVGVSTDKTFADSTDAAMYLAIKVGDEETAIQSTSAAEYNATVKKAPAGAYEYKYDSGYKYELKSDLAGIEFSKLDFAITGACNANGDWSKLASATPAIKVTWDVKKANNVAPTIGTKSYQLTAQTPINITANLGSGDSAAKGISSIVWNGTDILASGVATFDASSSEITLTAVGVDYWLANPNLPRNFVVTFDDENSTSVTITLTE